MRGRSSSPGIDPSSENLHVFGEVAILLPAFRRSPHPGASSRRGKSNGCTCIIKQPANLGYSWSTSSPPPVKVASTPNHLSAAVGTKSEREWRQPGQRVSGKVFPKDFEDHLNAVKKQLRASDVKDGPLKLVRDVYQLVKEDVDNFVPTVFFSFLFLSPSWTILDLLLPLPTSFSCSFSCSCCSCS